MTKLVLLTVVAGLVAPGAAVAESRNVAIRDNAFQPFRVFALTGDTVTWKNVGRNVHNVTSTSFPSSDDLSTNEDFSHTFAAPGPFPYRCTKHAAMTGAVSVADLHLFGPATPVVYGRTVTFTGLAPSGAMVEIKRGTDTMGTATAGSDGRFSVPVPAPLPGQYAATAGGKTSSAVALKVRPRVVLTTRRSGRTAYVTVSTRPAQAGAPVVLQRRTASGWARVGSARLNSRSKATFKVVVRGTTKLRAKLTRGVGGYSPSTSAIVTLR